MFFYKFIIYVWINNLDFRTKIHSDGILKCVRILKFNTLYFTPENIEMHTKENLMIDINQENIR